MSTTYRYLKFKINTNLLDECKSLVYYNYADRDLKDAITACAIKSPDGMPNNMFKVYPDTCDSYRFTNICGIIPNTVSELLFCSIKPFSPILIVCSSNEVTNSCTLCPYEASTI